MRAIFLTVILLVVLFCLFRDEVLRALEDQREDLSFFYTEAKAGLMSGSFNVCLTRFIEGFTVPKAWTSLCSVATVLAVMKFVADICEEESPRHQQFNKLQTTAFKSIPLLVVGESFSYFSSISNLVAMSIGIVQLIVAGKKINLIINTLTYLQQVFLSFRLHQSSAAADSEQNSSEVWVRGKGEKPGRRLAEQIQLEDEIEMHFGDVTPAFIKITGITSMASSKKIAFGYHYARRQSGEDVSQPFAVDSVLGPNIEMTRPDCKIVGKVVELLGRQAGARPGKPTFMDVPIIIMDAISLLLLTLLAFTIAASAAKHTILNNPSESAVFMKKAMFYFIAALSSFPAVVPGLRFVLMQLIFSMIVRAAFWRVTVQQYPALEQIQNIKSLTFDKTGTLTDHKVFNVFGWYPIAGALEELRKITGWSTEELICALTLANSETSVLDDVAYIDIKKKHGKRPPVGGAPGVDNDGLWGVSPEENEMVRWLMQNYNLKIIHNPLKNDRGHIEFQAGEKQSSEGDDRPIRKIEVKDRRPYKFQVGKIAHVRLCCSPEADESAKKISMPEADETREISVNVRQTGWSFLVDEENNEQRKNEMTSWFEEDPRRAIGLAVIIFNTDSPTNGPERLDRTVSSLSCFSDNLDESSIWEAVGAYTFENPVRDGVVETMQFFRNKFNLGPGMLTGDAQEAAEAIARNAGICSPTETIYRLTANNNGRLCVEMENESPQEFEKWFSQEGQHRRTVSVAGATIEQCSQKESIHTMLTAPNLNRIMFRATEKLKKEVTTIAQKSGPVMHVGDAANDASAIAEAELGVCLAHGADSSRAVAKIILHTPEDLVEVLANNGFADMMIIGSVRLFTDICVLSGFISSIYLFGVYDKGFVVFHNERTSTDIPLFKDIWKDEHYWVMSNLYFLSVLPYATAECTADKREGTLRMMGVFVFRMAIAMAQGYVAGTVLKLWSGADEKNTYGFAAVHLITLMYLITHSWHCIGRHWRPKADRNVVGFGPQYRSKHAKFEICRFLSYLDSVWFRVFLYWIFQCCARSS